MKITDWYNLNKLENVDFDFMCLAKNNSVGTFITSKLNTKKQIELLYIIIHYLEKEISKLENKE